MSMSILYIYVIFNPAIREIRLLGNKRWFGNEMGGMKKNLRPYVGTVRVMTPSLVRDPPSIDLLLVTADPLSFTTSYHFEAVVEKQVRILRLQ